MNEPPPGDNDRPWLQTLSPRVAGFVLLGCASVMGWLCVWEPLRDAANHADSISMSLKGVVLAPMALAMGVLYSAKPVLAVRILGTPKERKPAFLFYIPLLLLGLAVYVVLKSKIQSYGYRV